jgi:lipid A 3-O-deacylase
MTQFNLSSRLYLILTAISSLISVPLIKQCNSSSHLVLNTLLWIIQSNNFIGYFVSRIMKIKSFLLISLLLTMFQFSYADTQWQSVTFDNDLFRGSDNGYTNGLYYSWIDVETDATPVIKNVLTQPFEFLLPDETILLKASGYTLGQTMITPSDITIEDPNQDEVPYSGLLVFTNSSLYIYEDYADYIGASFGIVGPASLAGDSQKSVHSATGSTEPEGWGTQLNDEFVFTISRKRSWRTWKSNTSNMEFITSAGVAAGTIESHAKVSTMLIYGSNLGNSFASALLSGNRTSNPIAIGGGWFVFHCLSAGYTLNNIALDGNTFQNSRSVNYQHNKFSVMTGIAYSWHDWSLTLALVDDNVLSSDLDTDDATQYGSFTVGWVPG